MVFFPSKYNTITMYLGYVVISIKILKTVNTLRTGDADLRF